MTEYGKQAVNAFLRKCCKRKLYKPVFIDYEQGLAHLFPAVDTIDDVASWYIVKATPRLALDALYDDVSSNNDDWNAPFWFIAGAKYNGAQIKAVLDKML